MLTEPIHSRDQMTQGLGQGLPKWTLYSLRNLPLSSFMEALIDSNLSVLGTIDDIIAAGEENVKAHWEKLQMEFSEAITTSSTRNAIQLEATILYFTTKIERIQRIVDFLSIQYHPEIAQLLKEDDFSYEFSEESYLQDLEAVVAESRRYVIYRDQFIREREKGKGESTKLDYEYFASVLNAISDMVKRDVNETISTLRFCKYYVQLVSLTEKQAHRGNR